MRSHVDVEAGVHWTRHHQGGTGHDTIRYTFMRSDVDVEDALKVIGRRVGVGVKAS